ncbi:MAG: hypothetical protein I8H86_06035 [Sphingomonadaceae bacterium]|nr:hypothetical protein [Sphingomonadaceae bacterium]
MAEQDEYRSRLFHWVGALTQALMREPAVILLEREGDGPGAPDDREDKIRPYRATTCR